MLRFLTFYFLTYMCLHAVVYLRLRPLLNLGRWGRLVVWLFVLVMILAPMGARFLEVHGLHFMARMAAWAAYLWMGVIIVMVMASIDTFLIEGVWQVIARLGVGRFSPSAPRIMAVIAVISGLIVFGYGLYEARNVRLEYVQVASRKLPPGRDRFRIAQVTDLHFGLMTSQAMIDRITGLIRQAQPDLLVATGDTIDGTTGYEDNLKASLQSLKIPYGMIAVTGNHEVYHGMGHSVTALQHWGFLVLRNQGVTLDDTVNIVGVDDAQAGTVVNEKALLTKSQNGLFTVLLKHRPDIRKESLGLFDLQLSGHAHGGQIFPFNYVVERVYPLMYGFYDLGHGSALYTSRGTGAWGPPIRFLAPPEVTVIDIVPE
jgi:predicted MPP superfamily phosphohydrolase